MPSLFSIVKYLMSPSSIIFLNTSKLDIVFKEDIKLFGGPSSEVLGRPPGCHGPSTFAWLVPSPV